eukprot:CAMPEP_0117004918 /NCGR_PEP_ID=MMETSP0472-20121206/5728_1 /TAXON_ID=693140 ORGANISM="Tiarina fusus, Strain LIS" /NCGR_SAMPLE_ID=MMETSP0472 /ASSEMBLY_ACC=CAM_ASM_000603 /LENGTH=610 /DNA_ID=CAMNT_0004706027 /DNA_START=73 /DNA_END=1901 /DNA_ORIENTATION=+
MRVGKFSYATTPANISQIYAFTSPARLDQDEANQKRWKRFTTISPSVRKSIVKLGWEKPTDIQRKVFQLALKDRSIVASSETGSGKTAAYGAALLSFIEKYRANPKNIDKELEPQDTRFPRGEYSPLGLILCPTRELAIQVHRQLNELSTEISPPIRIESISHSMIPDTLKTPKPDTPVDIVIATPGKILAHLRQRSKFLTHSNKDPTRCDHFQEQGLDLGWVRWHVIDECDRLLSMGFFPDIKEILTYMPRPRKKVPIITPSTKRTQEEKEGRKIITHVSDRMKVLLFTATLLPEINSLIKRIAPQHSMINLNTTVSTAANVDDIVHLVSNRRKYSLLKYYLKRRGSIKYENVLVFCRTQQRVERLVETLEKDGFAVGQIYKELSARKRLDVLEDFKNKKIQILVATDVLGRGIDIEGLPYVINYDLPSSAVDYIHRVGRTGRAGMKGKAISFVGASPMMLNFGGRYVEHNEQHVLQKIRSATGKSLHFRKVPGPWSDDPTNSIVQHDEMHSQQFMDKRHKEIMKIMHSKEERVLGKGMLERLKARADARNKNPTRARYLPATELTKGLSLRQFRHGRYEDMIVDYDIDRARSRGVVVPSKFAELTNKL